jgi:hypothetical protein
MNACLQSWVMVLANSARIDRVESTTWRLPACDISVAATAVQAATSSPTSCLHAVLLRCCARHTTADEDDGQSIEMAFSKKKVDDRKRWLSAFQPGTYLDQSVDNISYKDFVHKVRCSAGWLAGCNAFPPCAC